jgi:hypothetical protein
MDPERQLGAFANGFHEAINGVSRKWTPSGAQQGVTCPMRHEKLTIRE